MSADGISLVEYISSGPLIEACGITPESIQVELAGWRDLGAVAAKHLGFSDIDNLDDVQRLRIFRYYLPVFFWCRRQLEEHKRAAGADAPPAAPLVIGISAPQGSGKSTLVEQLELLFQHTGSTAVGVSIDDFYLTFADQQRVAAEHSGNKLLELRGNAGSHDLQLGTDTLTALKAANRGGGAPIGIPRYDKSAHSGRGDRAPADTWPQVSGHVDLVLFEGWMLGFRPVSAADAAAVDADLAPVNEKLREYESAWDAYADVWLVVKVPEPTCVYKWRLQAEVAMRSKGKPGMTDEQVADFVDRYMPAYRAYLTDLYAKGPTTCKAGCLLEIEINASRTPVSGKAI